MWPFKRKERVLSAEIESAQAARTRAIEVMREVNARKPEVDEHYQNLRTRKLRNNFGPALMIAMEKRP